MNEFSSQADGNKDTLEETLRAYRLAAPAQNLRERVLRSISEQPGLPRFELMFRWALAALILTFVWASWTERQTGERMARLAAASNVRAQSHATAPLGEVPEKDLGEKLIAGLMHPRFRLPLGPGISSTRMNVSFASIVPVPKGDVS